MKTPEGGEKAVSAVKEYSGSDLRLQRQTDWSELHTVHGWSALGAEAPYLPLG